MLSWFIAQVIKIMVDCIRNKTINIRLMTSSGGMPSSHSSFVCALAVSMGIEYGFDSALFAVCFALGMIVMYDASGIRRAAGKQAEVLNIVIEKHSIKVDTKLKELLGHTPFQVFAGAALGIFISVIMYK